MIRTGAALTLLYDQSIWFYRVFLSDIKLKVIAHMNVTYLDCTLNYIHLIILQLANTPSKVREIPFP